MTPDNIFSSSFVLAVFAVIVLRAAYCLFHEAHQLVADARMLTERAEQTARETLEARQCYGKVRP